MSNRAKADTLATDGVDPLDSFVVIGTGFVGLPLALLLAHNGKEVVGVDLDQNLVEAINDQSLRLDDEELQRLLESEEVQANLEAQTSPTTGDAFVISVPTPLTDPDKSPDLSHIEASIESILPYLEEGDLINIESTVPPLTLDEVITPKLRNSGFVPGQDIQLTHSPERILPGNVFEEIVQNDRVIGGVNKESIDRAAKIYEPFLEGEIYRTDLVSAELCKLMENTYRDVNIALANEFALIGEELDIDMGHVIEIANNHPRVDILRPGIGVGGHCLPVDPWFLNEVDPEHTNLITTARRINDMMPSIATRNIRHSLQELTEPHIVALGAAYKAETYDVRNSPAKRIVRDLRLDGYQIDHYDRHVDGMDYGSVQELLESEMPDVVLQLVPHRETLSEIELMESWLAENGIQLLQFGTGKPLDPQN